MIAQFQRKASLAAAAAPGDNACSHRIGLIEKRLKAGKLCFAPDQRYGSAVRGQAVEILMDLALGREAGQCQVWVSGLNAIAVADNLNDRVSGAVRDSCNLGCHGSFLWRTSGKTFSTICC